MMIRTFRKCLFSRWVCLILLAGGIMIGYGVAWAEPPRLGAVRVAAVINPTVADFVVAQLTEANREQRAAFLLELDTPGGLDSAMRSLIQGILGSEIPVIVYVHPGGARAASAGALITLAADFAVMSPGTNIGAAHPVALGLGGEQSETMRAKVVEDAVAYIRSIARQRDRDVDAAEAMVRESRSFSAEEALDRGLVDLLAADTAELLAKLDGATYERRGESRLLRSAGGSLLLARMGWRQQVLNAISQPTVAYLLLMLGLLGIFFEISQPGAIFPGAVGAIALLLAFFAFQTLPVNYVGVLFILLALVLFLLEVAVTSYGLLTVGGIVAMTFGSLMLGEYFPPFLRLSLSLIAGTVAVFSGLFLIIVFFVFRTQKRPFFSGAEGMVGKLGEALTDIHQEGQVFVHGESWRAFSALPVARGETVVVVRVDDCLRLEVRPVSSPSGQDSSA